MRLSPFTSMLLELYNFGWSMTNFNVLFVIILMQPPVL